MRKRTGLRNRFRNGKGTYCTRQKSRKADNYDRPMLDHPDHPSGRIYACCDRKIK